MRLSERIQRLKPSPTVALNASAKKLRQKGVEVLNFAVGEPDFPTPHEIVGKAVTALENGKTRYGPAGGGAELRGAISEKLKNENGLEFPAEHIVAGCGAKEVLFHTFLALLNEGDEVLVPTPYWVSYPDQIKAAGGVPVPVPMAENFDESPVSPVSLEQLKAHATDKTVAVVLNSPNNPAGYVLSREFLEELGGWLKEKDWWIISDEIYEYMAFDREHISLLNLCPELKDRFLLVNGLSKGFAMTGWRVGYVTGPEAPMGMVRGLQSHSSTCIPPFIEEAATLALERGRELVASNLEQLKVRRDLACRLAREIPKVQMIPPQGAFYMFLDVRPVLKDSAELGDTDTLSLGERLLFDHHIAVVPGEAFGAPGFLRFSYATADETIEKGLERLQDALSRLS